MPYAKISQLVNDHLHNSQKRRDGSSLVVETGFPTSLIDLFIKNRENLKKSNKKKRPITPILSPVVVHDSVVSRFPSPLPPPSPVITDCPIPRPSPSQVINEVVQVEASVVVADQKEQRPSEGINEISAVKANEAVGDQRKRGADANGVLLAVLKMFLVLGLAWGIKRLTLGITLSAFLLFFLDYLGKRADGLFKPGSEAKGVSRILRLVILKAFILLRFRKDKLNQTNEGFKTQEMTQEDSCTSLKSYEYRNQEIQPVETERDLIPKLEEIQCENEIKETKLKELLMEKDEFVLGVVELERKKSKMDKIKSKMRKCFVKKTQSCEKEGDRPEIVCEDRVNMSEELEIVQCKNEEESNSVSRLSIDSTSADCGFDEVLEINHKKTSIKMEEGIKEQEYVKKWRCFVLGSIALIGLVQGRAFALVLTLSWFLLLKLGETLSMHLKVPVIRFSKR